MDVATMLRMGCQMEYGGRKAPPRASRLGRRVCAKEKSQPRKKGIPTRETRTRP